MKKCFVICACLFVIQWSFGQLPSSNKNRKQEKLIIGDHETTENACYKIGTESPDVRRKHYPFNVADNVQLVSFLGKMHVINSDTGYIPDGLPMLNDTICLSQLHERKTLSSSQIDTLTNVIFNIKAKPGYHIASVGACYMPRNAILFLDSTGKVLEYVEICFECHRTRESSEKVSLGSLCNEKLELIYRVFKRAGIEYGITKGRVSDVR